MQPLYLLAAPATGLVVAAADAATDQITAGIIAPILSTGVVGAFLLMILFRIKIMPTYVYDDAKALWEKSDAAKDAAITELKEGLKEANSVYTSQVIPTLTRVLDSERELVDIRRDEQARRRRGETA